ncbi:hypothetical protein CPB97_007989 [Podila verticillata]|nr:hypothetical protein CPB97_007989 [Podila verticillata]
MLSVYNRLTGVLPFTIRRTLIGLVRQNPGFIELRVSTALFRLSTYKETICSAPSLHRLWVDSGVSPEHIRMILSVLPETIEDITFMVDNNAEHADVPKRTEIIIPHLPKLTAFEVTTIQPFRDDTTRAVLANFGIFLEKNNTV